ncbi:MAG: RNA polymerase sigma factor [Clostridia bacterium]|nr:RNA polymerase sigma factor [Clostridia bacterium]
MQPIFSANAVCAKAITEISQGNMQRLDVLYEQLGRQIYALALTILNNRADAEDAMQDTFLKVARHAASFDEKGNARAWVMAIARNAALDIQAQRLRNVPVEESRAIVAEAGDFTAECELKDLLSSLPDLERQIVLLKAAEGFRYAEIGETLGLTAEAVRKKYKRALQKLKSEYR